MKSLQRNVLIALGALATLTLIVAYSMSGATFILGGEPVTGLLGAGFALGGTLIGVFAVVLSLFIVSIVLTGVSLFVVVVLALAFLVAVLALSPLVLPLALLAGMVWFFCRKKSGNVATA